MTLTFGIFTFGSASEISRSQIIEIAYGTCTYTIYHVTSEGVTETTYQTETRTEEECRLAAENHLQYLRTIDALNP